MTRPTKPRLIDPTHATDDAADGHGGNLGGGNPGGEGVTGTRTVSPAERFLSDLTEDLREGRIAAAGIVDAIVARAIESDTARALTDDGRRALEAHLRSTLANDPAISRLVEDLERAR